LLGPFGLRANGSDVNLRIAGPTRDVFAFLVLNADRELPRSRALAQLWPDRGDHSARGLLNTAVWRIRRALAEAAPGVGEIDSSGDMLRLSLAPGVTVDLRDLERAVAALEQCAGDDPLAVQAVSELARALSQPDAEFLENADHEWVLVERERVFSLQVRALGLLMRHWARARNYEEALTYGRRILRLDALHEGAQQQVMWLYVLAGRRSAAIRQYRSFRATLRADVGIAPMPETQALYDHILSLVPDPGAADGPPPAGLPAAAASIDSEQQRLDQLFAVLAARRRLVLSALSD